MNIDEYFNKVMSFKKEDENGNKIDFLSDEEKSKLSLLKKSVYALKLLTRLSFIIGFVSLVIIVFLAATLKEDLNIPNILGLGFFLGFIFAGFFYALLYIINSKYISLLKFYYNKENKNYEKKDSIFPVASAIAGSLTNVDKDIMQNVINCGNDPKTYYLIHKDEINKHKVNLIDNNCYILSGVMSLLEANNYVSIIEDSCSKEDFLNALNTINKEIDFRSIKLIDEKALSSSDNLFNWTCSINNVIKSRNKALILYDISKVYENQTILFIIDLDKVQSFTKIPGIYYIIEGEIINEYRQ